MFYRPAVPKSQLPGWPAATLLNLGGQDDHNDYDLSRPHQSAEDHPEE